MAMNTQITTYTAFSGNTFLANGQLSELALKIKRISETAQNILIFNDQTGRQIDLDLSGSELEIQQRYSEIEAVKKVGRPKLGLVRSTECQRICGDP